MTDMDRKRAYVYDLYPGPKWKHRVSKVMPDEQVVAIYLKHIQDGAMPEHEESEPDIQPEPLMDVPKILRGPHVNEDDFPVY